GLSGLATAYAFASDGHRVRLFERASGIASVPGGIRLPPNATKILVQWGMGDELREKSAVITSATFCDLHTGEIVGRTEWMPSMFMDSGGEFHMINHRDLCDMLYTRAVSAGAEFTFDSAITAISPPSPAGPHPSRSSASALGPQPSVTLASGDVVHADLLIGADGAQSLLRSVVDEQCPGAYTGTTMYTGVVNAARAAADQYLREIIEIGHPIWMGEGVVPAKRPEGEHAFHIECREDTDLGGPADWDSVPSSSIPHTDEFEPRYVPIRHLLKCVPQLTRVRCCAHPPAENWVDAARRILLTGQAAHPMLPCAMHQSSDCLESAAVLSTLLSHLRAPAQLPSLLYAYHDLRAPRAARLHDLELKNRFYLCMEGDLRVARDENMRASLVRRRGDDGAEEEDDGGQLARQWAELSEVWGYDAREEAEEWWIRWGLLRERAGGVAGKGADADADAAGSVFGVGGVPFEVSG
ncbi:hypothetical protein HETIRDRAFT_312653, partial [Heterobasidion irregulare TC 32-1]